MTCYENEIYKLKQQLKEKEQMIEKMKCCFNCEYYDKSTTFFYCGLTKEIKDKSEICDKWELAE